MSDSLIDDAVRRASRVEGWMYEEELRWLAEHASRSTSIIEVGIWKGRSTTALCHAAAGRVYAIDHFQGSPEERSYAHREAAENPDSVYRQAFTNLQPYLATSRLELLRQESGQAADVLRSRGLFADLIFLDAAHDEASISHDIEAFLPLLKDSGILCGHDREWPGVAAALRRLFPEGWECGVGSLWIVRPREMHQAVPTPADGLACAVVIPCHNYGQYLAECLASVLAQSRPAAEILVVLDDCSDDSADVAATFRERGVRSLSVRCCDPYLSRRVGFRATRSPFVCFLDADDRISADYLDAGLPLFLQPDIGIVAADVHEFGLSNAIWSPEPGDLRAGNCVNSAGIARRIALEGTRAFEQLDGVGVFAEDWLTWRKLAACDWEIAKSAAIHHYRRHDRNLTLACSADWAAQYVAAAPERPSTSVRVAFLTDALVTGGVFSHLQMMAKYARRVAWAGVVVADGGSTDEYAVTATNALMPVFSPRWTAETSSAHENGPKLRSAAEALASLAPSLDAIYVWGQQLSSLLAPYAGRIPIVFALHATGWWGRDMAKSLSGIASEIIGVAEACRDCLPSEDRSRLKVIPNSVDLARLIPREPRWAVRQRWGISKDQLAIGFVGRWSSEKNPWALARAVGRLGPRAVAVYCGPQCANDGSLIEADTRRQIGEITESRVVWTWSETMGEVYRALDCLVLPSHEEGEPLVAIEAFAASCPLVATPVGSLPLLRDEIGPFHVSVPLDPSVETLASAILTAVAPSNRPRVERAKEFAWNQRSAQRMVRDWEAVFCSATEAKQC